MLPAMLSALSGSAISLKSSGCMSSMFVIKISRVIDSSRFSKSQFSASSWRVL